MKKKVEFITRQLTLDQEDKHRGKLKGHHAEENYSSLMSEREMCMSVFLYLNCQQGIWKESHRGELPRGPGDRSSVGRISGQRLHLPLSRCSARLRHTAQMGRCRSPLSIHKGEYNTFYRV